MAMTRKSYVKIRNGLLIDAQRLIDNGRLNEYRVIERKIKNLDTRYHTMTSQIFGHGPEYLNAWTRFMQGHPLSEHEEFVMEHVNQDFQNTTQTAKEHVVVVPETIAAEIWREAAELYPILSDCVMTHVPGDMTIIREDDSGDDATWYDEETKVADGAFTLGELRLTGCELAKAIPVSWKLRKMAAEPFQKYIVSLLAEKMGAALAKGIVSGLGRPDGEQTHKPQPKGIITTLEAETDTPQVVTYTDEPTYETLVAAMSKLKSAYKSGAALYATSTFIWSKLATMKDASGRPLFINDVSLQGVGRIFGLPVKEEDSVPADGMLIGNVKRGYAVNVNEDMTIYTEDHKKERYTDYMAYSVVDGDVVTSKAFAYIKKEAAL